ncbi:PREDICTED: berberine bridge enzyme-like 21 [Ipomoea nil]|uniref:berberine bridge enzyme-like 21 n=1 Tax=Ipomoea nil TaxID=35883 RepID=UPI000901DA3D|nr:PREDICTED: berberine bridge enzyme-like 21 [Ipomoea nil]
MTECKTLSTPISTSKAVGIDTTLHDDPTQYKSLAVALQYLTITHPDISFAVNQLCQHMSAPTVSHLEQLKRVLRYVKGIVTFGLRVRQSSSREIHALSDSDWAGCLEDRNLQVVLLCFFGSNLVTRVCKKQRTVARSSTETEYKALANVCVEVIWIMSLLREIHVPYTSDFYQKFVDCLTTTAKPPIPKDQVSKIVYEPKNEKFLSILNAYVRNRCYNTSSSSKPDVIVTPLEETHVPGIVTCALDVGVPIKVRSGGHDFEGLSYVAGSEYLILDMFNLRSVEVDVGTQTAWVQTGATLGELYYRISEKSPTLGFPAGTAPTIGIGGHISGGGYGNMVRQYGLTVDHVVDARFVDAKGKVLDRKGMGEDLFWAIRGGGGASFGVILAYKIQLVKVPEKVTHFAVERSMEEHASNVVSEFQKAVETMDPNLFIRLVLKPTPEGENKKKNDIKLTAMGLFLGESAKLLPIMEKEMPALGLESSDCQEMTWIQSVIEWANYDHTAKKPEILLGRVPDEVFFTKRKSDFVMTPIPKVAIESMLKKMIELGDIELKLNSFGGKLPEICSDVATPFPHRSGVLYLIQYAVSWKEEGSEGEMLFVQQARDMYEFMTPFVSSNPRRAYLNYRDVDLGTTEHGVHALTEGRMYGTMYFNKNYDKLARVKTMVDHRNFFRNIQSIPPLSQARPRNRKQADSS